jgi:hypothetical protein
MSNFDKIKQLKIFPRIYRNILNYPKMNVYKYDFNTLGLPCRTGQDQKYFNQNL